MPSSFKPIMILKFSTVEGDMYVVCGSKAVVRLVRYISSNSSAWVWCMRLAKL